MNVQTISMSPDQARRALRSYRAQYRKRLSAECEEIALAYSQLAKGTPILQLSIAIANAPRDAKGRPRIAIARADRRQVTYEGPNWQHPEEEFSTTMGGGAPGPTMVIRVPPSANTPTSHVMGYALVPLVPPAHAAGHDLAQHFVLWEVEAWADRRISVHPDRDPYLLKQISPDLYAIIAEWDLTEVERAIMATHRRDS